MLSICHMLTLMQSKTVTYSYLLSLKSSSVRYWSDALLVPIDGGSGPENLQNNEGLVYKITILMSYVLLWHVLCRMQEEAESKVAQRMLHFAAEDEVATPVATEIEDVEIGQHPWLSKVLWDSA